MTHPVTGIDHAYLLVNDLAKSHDQFRRLGFTVSPLGLHSAAKGTANHTIMFQHDYLELMGIVAETPDNAGRRERLAQQGEGLHALIGRTMNAEEAKPELARLGIRTGEVQRFSRPVPLPGPLPGGSEAEAAFRTLDFEPEEVPVGTSFLCEHLTPEAVWIPELMEHANTATGLAGIIAAVSHPKDTAAGFARLFGAGRGSTIKGGMRVETGNDSASLIFLSHPALAARYPNFYLGRTPKDGFAAVQFHVRNIGHARNVIEKSGLSAITTETGFALGPEFASGAIVEFIT